MVSRCDGQYQPDTMERKKKQALRVPACKVRPDIFEVYRTSPDDVQCDEVKTWLQSTFPNGLDNCGRFWFTSDLELRRLDRLRKIHHEFTDDVIRDKLLPMIAPFNSPKSSRVSLRTLDWLVTNFAKKNTVVFSVQPPGSQAMRFNVYNEYKSWLRRYRRLNFDPFRRYVRVYFVFDGRIYSTTTGQLNFMNWAFHHNLVNYAHEHLSEIERDMTSTMKLNTQDKEEFKRKGVKRKRKPLSEAPVTRCVIYPMPMNLKFHTGK